MVRVPSVTSLRRKVQPGYVNLRNITSVFVMTYGSISSGAKIIKLQKSGRYHFNKNAMGTIINERSLNLKSHLLNTLIIKSDTYILIPPGHCYLPS